MTILMIMSGIKILAHGVRVTSASTSDRLLSNLGGLLSFAGPARQYPATTAAVIETAAWNGVGRQLGAAMTKIDRERSAAE